jgi:hypothetical protein
VSKPFDVTTKYLVETRPGDWLAYLGISHAQADVIDADLAAVSAEADKVLRVNVPTPWLVHLEFQSSYDDTLPERTLQYSVLLRRRHGLAVQSVIVLLRPEADGSDLTGTLRHLLPDGTVYLEFGYRMMRVWQASVETVLSGGLGVLPLAPLSAVSREQLPGVIRRMEQRIRQEAAPDEAGILRDWRGDYCKESER